MGGSWLEESHEVDEESESEMTRYVPEGTVEVWLVPTVAVPAAPTAIELNAGALISGQMIGDLDLPFEGSVAEAGDMSSRFNKAVPGDYGGQAGSFTIHKEKLLADDTVFTALVRDVTGYLAVAVRGLSTPETWAIGDEVDLWPVTVLSRAIQYARNQTTSAAVQDSIDEDPTEDIVHVA